MLRASGKGVGPAAVGFDDFVDFAHQADGFGEGDDDLVVVRDVLVAQGAAGIALFRAAVLEPLLADLVASDMEVPDLLRDGTEAAGARLGLLSAALSVDPNRAAVVGGVDDFRNLPVASDELCDGSVEGRRFQQVQGGEFATNVGESAEEFETAGQG